MKKITIGRGRDCDIRLEDSTDMVSRRQAVITVSPSGKMQIYDTSSNGTYVNGEKIEKPNGKVIKRGDQINFAHVVDLDWDQVKDPYKAMKITWLIIILAVIIVAVLFFVFADQILNRGAQEETATEQVKDTVPDEEKLELQIPKETSTPKAIGTKSSGKAKTNAPKTNNETPETEGTNQNTKPVTDKFKNNPQINDSKEKNESEKSKNTKLFENIKNK